MTRSTNGSLEALPAAPLRRALDLVYAVSLWLAALCLVAITLLVAVQLGGRIYDGLLKLTGRPPHGFAILALSELSGCLMAAAGFLGLAGTLKAGAHIRVTLVIGMLPESLRRLFEIAAMAGAALFASYITWFLFRQAMDSWRFNEIVPALVPIPLWPPHAAMAAGAALLTIAIVDELVTVITRGRPSFRAAEDAITLGKEG